MYSVKKLILILFLFFSQSLHSQHLLQDNGLESSIPIRQFFTPGAPYIPCAYWKFVASGIPNLYYANYGCYCDSFLHNKNSLLPPLKKIINIGSINPTQSKYPDLLRNTNPAFSIFLDKGEHGNLQIRDIYNRKLRSIPISLEENYVAFNNGEYEKGVYVIEIYFEGKQVRV